jgi:hypothetical protein
MAEGNGMTTFARTMKAVFWSFFGVRKRRDFEADTQLNPLHVVLAALLLAALFICLLLVVVHAVVH